MNPHLRASLLTHSSQGLTVPFPAGETYTTNGLTWTQSAIRMNHIQVIATHNSYHREVSPEERSWHSVLLSSPINYYYSHAALDVQLSRQSVRSIELDIWADPPPGGNYAHPLIRKLSGLAYPDQQAMSHPGAKVMHVPDRDVGTTCLTLTSCLTVVRDWSLAHPLHVPISIQLEFKTAASRQTRDLLPGLASGTRPVPWNDTVLLAQLDDEIRSVFPAGALITPDDLRRPGMTLEESVLAHGWPDLDSARGRVLFVMDDGPRVLGAVRDAYVEGRPSLEGRVIFSQSAPGEPDCAFQKMNEPRGEENLARIREQVARGYWVRTRADVPLETVLVGGEGVTVMRDAALASGAQMVSTDWPVDGMSARYGVDYVVRFPRGRPAVCNPVNAPESCTEETELEPAEYFRG